MVVVARRGRDATSFVVVSQVGLSLFDFVGDPKAIIHLSEYGRGARESEEI